MSAWPWWLVYLAGVFSGTALVTIVAGVAMLQTRQDLEDIETRLVIAEREVERFPHPDRRPGPDVEAAFRVQLLHERRHPRVVR